jgi:hypothetical protein
MLRQSIYRILEVPLVYRLAQVLLAPGTAGFFRRYFETLPASADRRPWLDVGCGPDPYVVPPTGGLIAIDLEPAYIAAMDKPDSAGVVGDAARLPFADGSFGKVWSIGMLHHLPDPVARAAIGEMLRVGGTDGQVVIFDAVLPEPWWMRPHAYAIRRLDRGEFMRTEAALRALLPAEAAWQVERRTYTFNGLELLICTGTLGTGDDD